MTDQTTQASTNDFDLNLDAPEEMGNLSVGEEEKESIIVKGIRLLFIGAFFTAILIGYHLFYVQPTLDAAKTFYTLDTKVISDAYLKYILDREKENDFQTPSEDINQEIEIFTQDFNEQISILSQGFPVFEKGTVLRADKTRIIDLTPSLAQRYNLVLSE